MLSQIRVAAAAALVAVLATAAVAQSGKKSPAVLVPGEDEYRSATGYTVAVMEHCKAINRLARGTGGFNAELAREHAAEISRNVASASRHLKGYAAALDSGRRGQVSDQFALQTTNEGDVARLAVALGDALKSPSPDRKTVAETVTALYLAERDLLAAHRAAGKTLGIRAATPPRNPTPRKPKAPKSGARADDSASTKRPSK